MKHELYKKIFITLGILLLLIELFLSILPIRLVTSDTISSTKTMVTKDKFLEYFVLGRVETYNQNSGIVKM